MAAKERKERKGLGDFGFWSRCPGLAAITAMQKGRSRCRDIGMSRYGAGPLNAGWNAAWGVMRFGAGGLRNSLMG
jgi:hypothetical protein